MIRYRDNMTPAEAEALLKETARLDECHAQSQTPQDPTPDPEWESQDPRDMGWIGRDGRP